jgi:hypothetical protein
MKLRRLFALLTSVAMLHLTVAAADVACATHGASGHHATQASDDDAAQHTMPTDGHLMPMTEGSEASVASVASVVGSDAPPCEVPTQQHCCDAIAVGGCGVDSALSSAPEAVASSVSRGSRIHVVVDDAPAAFAPAPEPPPPKA